MPLNSDLFTKDKAVRDRLNLALTDDSKNVTPGQRGAHVSKIQEALFILINPAPNLGDEVGSSFYGPLTSKAVFAYKEKKNGTGRPILGPGQQKPDSIVGKRTIKQLDEDLLRLQGKSIGKLNPVVQQPGGERFLITEATAGAAGAQKSDRDISPRDLRGVSIQTRSLVNQMRTSMSRQSLESLVEGELITAAGNNGSLMARTMFGNNLLLSEKRFPSINGLVAADVGFTQAAAAFEERVVANLREQFKSVKAGTDRIDYHDLVTGSGPSRLFSEITPPFEPGSQSGRLLPSLTAPSVRITTFAGKALIGSFQEFRVFLTDFEGAVTAGLFSFKATLIFELVDVFGVDDTDCESDMHFHGTPGQQAFWILQHFHRPGHMPFKLVVSIPRMLSRTLA